MKKTKKKKQMYLKFFISTFKRKHNNQKACSGKNDMEKTTHLLGYLQCKDIFIMGCKILII